MYPGPHAQARADHPALVMAGSGESVSYRELEARSNRLAHLLRAAGLRRLDHYAIFMENHPRFVECCAAGERSGLYYTCINSFLTAPELAYIVNNSLSKVLITSQAKREVALEALADCPRVELCLIVDGPGDGTRGAQSRRGDGRLFRQAQSPTRRWARRCSTPPARPGGRRACCARCPTGRPPNRCRCSPRASISGAFARARSIFRPRRSITRRRYPASAGRSDAAERLSSWSGSTRSASSPSSSAIASRTPSLSRRCSRAC